MNDRDLIAWAVQWLRTRHPIRTERNGQGHDVCYMQFTPYWFAIGLTASIADWQYGNMAPWCAARIVWA